MFLTSLDNSRIKLVRKLALKKHRDASGKFVIEGSNLVTEALDRAVVIDFILKSEDYDDIALSEACERAGIEVFELSRDNFEKLTEAGNGVGLLAVVNKPCECKPADFIRKSDNILVLDRVQDPGNIGTMIRTAVAAGYSMIVMVKGTADVFSPKVLRATAGMIFDMPFVYAKDEDELCELLHDLGKRICVTVPTGGKPYYEANMRSGIALVIGNEGNGISDRLIESADEKLTIPMQGAIESLNAAISAAILMYEAVRE